MMKTPLGKIELLESRITPAALAGVDLAKLDGANGFTIKGTQTDEGVGEFLQAAGDLNGDEVDDFVAGVGSTGRFYVVFGRDAEVQTAPVLGALDGVNGFAIGAPGGTTTINGVSRAGDVNGDGIGDLLVSFSETNAEASQTGGAYVVFGKTSGFAATLDLTKLDGTNGFRITGALPFNGDTVSVAAAGDVNGDDFDDVIIGSPGRDLEGVAQGLVFVVLGKGSGFTASLSLDDIGSNGWLISGGDTDLAGGVVASAGDVNGDGLADVAILRELSQAGNGCWIVFGRADALGQGTALGDLDGTNGFRLLPDATIQSVSAAGDVNSDGVDDVIFGAPGRVGLPGVLDSVPGQAFVLFGKEGTFPAVVKTKDLKGARGATILGGLESDLDGVVAGAGDLDGDGFDDLLLTGRDFTNNFNAATCVVYGGPNLGATPVRLQNLNGLNGFKIAGAEDAGSTITAAAGGDLNDDGLDDLLIGQTGAEDGKGAAHVVFGEPSLGSLRIAKGGTEATFRDRDGDFVTVKTTRGRFVPGDFDFAGGRNFVDLGGRPEFKGTSLTFSARTPRGVDADGRVDIGFLDASGIDLAGVTVSGDLGKILAGDTVPQTAGLKSLRAGSLGYWSSTLRGEVSDPLHSVITGSLGRLAIAGDVHNFFDVTGSIGPVVVGGSLTANLARFVELSGRTFDISPAKDFAAIIKSGGDMGPVTIKGDVIGGATNSGILSLGKMGAVTIGGDVRSDDGAKPVTIRALGKLGATKAADAVAIASVSVKGAVENARVLAGFGVGGVPLNPDDSIGAVSVGKTWKASSIAAGVADTSVAGNLASPADGFGRNDTRIGSDTTPALVSSIARITIKGAASGSTASGDFFGITAQRIGQLSITGVRIVPTGADTLVDATNGDFRRVIV